MPDKYSNAIFCIIASEFCGRFSFSGLRTILALYLRNILNLHESACTVVYHVFVMVCYFMPLLGAVLADNYFGRYKVILYFSMVYFIGTLLMCFATIPPLMCPPALTTMVGLLLVAAGTGAIKPCVAAFGGDQFQLPEESERLLRFFSIFYFVMNLGSFVGMVVTPVLRRSVMCFGSDTCYALGFGFAVILEFISIAIYTSGKKWYRIKKPKNSIAAKALSCIWYAMKEKLRYNLRKDGPPLDHWLDYAIDEYGYKLVADLKSLCSVLYLFLPVPIFWSLFDQQGSKWTFQATSLESEIFGVTLMPDQIQVVNPAIVLLLIPFCPGGTYQIVPDIQPLHKMFVGGMLTALAFICSGFLQLAIEKEGLHVPEQGQTGCIFMNTLPCPVEVTVDEEGTFDVEAFGTVLINPLTQMEYDVTITCPETCDGRDMKVHKIMQDLYTDSGLFMPIIIGQNSEDELNMVVTEGNAFSKSLSGKPMLQIVYLGEGAVNNNVSITIETDKQLSDVFYVSDAVMQYVGASNFLYLQPGGFIWRSESTLEGVSGEGVGFLKPGGVYVLCLRERLGRLDAAVLLTPNPPNKVHMLWAMPQYILISVAEIMFAVSGLEFAFTEAPKSMKTLTIAAWYMSVAFGNLIVIIVTKTKLFGHQQATEYFVFSAFLGFAMMIFLYMSWGYKSRYAYLEASTVGDQNEILKKSRAISVRSLMAPPTFTTMATASERSGLSSMTNW